MIASVGATHQGRTHQRVKELILENQESQNEVVISTIMTLLSERPSYIKLLKNLDLF